MIQWTSGDTCMDRPACSMPLNGKTRYFLKAHKMKFLCLAYGAEAGWQALTPDEQTEALHNDEVLKQRGDLLAAVQTNVVTVKNWGGQLNVQEAPFAHLDLPLAGFSVIEADSLDEVVRLVANTPCARASGAIEIRPFWNFGAQPHAALAR